MASHFVYILRNANGVYYKGSTATPSQRLSAHNSNESRYTAGKGPWEMVFLQKLANKRDALIRERALKKKGTEYLEWLITQPMNLMLNGVHLGLIEVGQNE